MLACDISWVLIYRHMSILGMIMKLKNHCLNKIYANSCKKTFQYFNLEKLKCPKVLKAQV